MTTTTMTFQESYGNLPLSTYRMVKMYNVSPADFDIMTDVLGFDAYRGDGIIDWSVIEDHIVSNSGTGMYRPDFY